MGALMIEDRTEPNIAGCTGLSYGTLYFIFLADPTLSGGSPAYDYTERQSDVLSEGGYFFVGSIVTPLAGGAETYGNNDGGAGAQNAKSQIFSATTTATHNTGGSTFTVIPGLTFTASLQGSASVYFQMTGQFYCATAYDGEVAFFIDGTQVSPTYSVSASSYQLYSWSYTASNVATGAHTLDVRFACPSGSITCDSGSTFTAINL